MLTVRSAEGSPSSLATAYGGSTLMSVASCALTSSESSRSAAEGLDGVPTMRATDGSCGIVECAEPDESDRLRLR